MRVWDINPGYLNNQSLLGEHREVHAIFSIVSNGKKGYSRHPETLRWQSFLGALMIRHEILVSEMLLRGFRHKSPVPCLGEASWPSRYIDPPEKQFALLKAKYQGKAGGRIALPVSPQKLWAQHKYSVLARDPSLYARIGKETASRKGAAFFKELAYLLVETLKTAPSPGTLKNALDHMWGYVSTPGDALSLDLADPAVLVSEIRKRSMHHGIRYLVESTALSDIAAWIGLQDRY
jgi:hypothetical protein